jgi:plasmid stability protein
MFRHQEDDVKPRRKRRAAHHGRSTKEEVHILGDAAKEQNQPVTKLGSRIAARFAKAGLTSGLPELRGERPRSVKFGK